MPSLSERPCAVRVGAGRVTGTPCPRHRADIDRIAAAALALDGALATNARLAARVLALTEALERQRRRAAR